MKTVLCYGDSNTWGYCPATKSRYKREERWPGILRSALGENYLVIEEGLGGRTTVWDDPIEEYKNGKTYLIPCLETHKPLDLVIILLGTNDLKARFSLNAFDIAKGVGTLVNIVKKSAAGVNGDPPPVLALIPPPVAKLTDFSAMFEGAQAKSRKLSEEFHKVLKDTGCFILDSGAFIQSSDIDGIHLDIDEQRKLGTAVADEVIKIIG